MTLRDRIGVDVGAQMGIEKSVEWAADNEVHYLDVCLDDGGMIDPEEYTEEDISSIRQLCDDNDVSLGLHTVSSVNVAETAPYVSEGVDKYLNSYVDIGAKVGAERIIVHGGYYFADDAIITQNQLDTDTRIAKSLDRLKRLLEYSDQQDPNVKLLLENHNQEPAESELQYVPITLEECELYFGELKDKGMKWCFNAPHARLFPEGIEGYVNSLGVDLADQVRLNDNNGEKEEHLKPGEGNLDFKRLFNLLEKRGHQGHYMLKFGTLDEMLESREYLIDLYKE